MANYFIIGGDGKQYGPITSDDLRKWIGEGRLNARTQAKAESDAEWRTLDTFPEFADVLGVTASPTSEPPTAAGSISWLENDYELDIAGCITRGWELVKENFGLLFVATLIYVLVEGVVSGLAQIPFIGPIFSIVNFVISGPLLGGVFYVFIRKVRSEPVEVGDVFAGFRKNFGQLFLGVLVPGLLIGVCLLPVIIICAVKAIPLASQLQQLHNSPPSPEAIAAVKSILLSSLPWFLVCLIPTTYLSVSWKFTLPLIMDKNLNVWPAMKASWKKTNRHWWHIFGLVFCISLLNLVGFCACCVGALFTYPIGVAALMIAYETLFNGAENR